VRTVTGAVARGVVRRAAGLSSASVRRPYPTCSRTVVTPSSSSRAGAASTATRAASSVARASPRRWRHARRHAQCPRSFAPCRRSSNSRARFRRRRGACGSRSARVIHRPPTSRTARASAWGSAGRLALSPTQAIVPAARRDRARRRDRIPSAAHVAIRAFVQSVSTAGGHRPHYTRKPSASRHGNDIVIDRLDHLVLTTAQLDRCVEFYTRRSDDARDLRRRPQVRCDSAAEDQPCTRSARSSSRKSRASDAGRARSVLHRRSAARRRHRAVDALGVSIIEGPVSAPARPVRSAPSTCATRIRPDRDFGSPPAR